MATKICRSRALGAALRPAKPSIQVVGEGGVRYFGNSARLAAYNVVLPKDAPNMRHAPRDPQGKIESPLVNPADKYASKADSLHKYGAWLMSCLPKFVQQFSVWKDELTIYISPSGVIPVFTFLKCGWSCISKRGTDG